MMGAAGGWGAVFYSGRLGKASEQRRLGQRQGEGRKRAGRTPRGEVQAEGRLCRGLGGTCPRRVLNSSQNTNSLGRVERREPRGRAESGSREVSGSRLLDGVWTSQAEEQRGPREQEVQGLGFKRVVHLQSKATRSSEPA